MINSNKLFQSTVTDKTNRLWLPLMKAEKETNDYLTSCNIIDNKH